MGNIIICPNCGRKINIVRKDGDTFPLVKIVKKI